MDPLLTALSQLGLGLAANAVYDLIKNLGSKTSDAQKVAEEIQNKINMFGVSMRAETVINALAQNGFLVIQQSHLHANQGLTFGSYQGSAIIGNNSSLTTNNTAMTAGAGAFMETQGSAQVSHNPDGSISFHVGETGAVNFKIAK